MSTHITRWLVGSLAILCCGWAGSAKADHYRHLSDQALIILQKSAALRREAVHYRHTPHYRHFLEDADALRRSALHVRVMVARRADLRHIREDLRDLDATLHHVQRLVRAIERDARHGVGFPDCDTRHVWDLLDCIEHCIEQMEDDVVALSRLDRRCVPVRPTPPPARWTWYDGSSHHRSGGITIQRGGLRLHFGF